MGKLTGIPKRRGVVFRGGPFRAFKMLIYNAFNRRARASLVSAQKLRTKGKLRKTCTSSTTYEQYPNPNEVPLLQLSMSGIKRKAVVPLEKASSVMKRDTKASDEELFAYFEKNADTYVERLSEFVAIPSVSADPVHRPDVKRAVEWYRDWCAKLGATCKLCDLGPQTLSNGTVLPLPPVLLAEFGADPAKKTVVIYGHLDVQPASLSDGWDTDPFKLTEKEGKLFGRGATDDKGPTTAWLWVIEALQKLGRELPVNLRCVFEGMEESGSIGLPALVYKLGRPGGYLDPAICDFVCISDNYYTGKKPCVTHGLRGNCYFHLSVQCSTKDLHSGVMGGSVHEAMTDLVKMMSTLVDTSGTILIPGIMDDVAPVTEKEMESYKHMDFDLEVKRRKRHFGPT